MADRAAQERRRQIESPEGDHYPSLYHLDASADEIANPPQFTCPIPHLENAFIPSPACPEG